MPNHNYEIQIHLLCDDDTVSQSEGNKIEASGGRFVNQHSRPSLCVALRLLCPSPTGTPAAGTWA